MKEIISKICKNVGSLGAAIIALCAGASLLVISCSTTGQSVTVGGETGKSGAQLWAENCVRCHNIRSPSSLSPVQWEVATMHMRIRANLTPEEHKKILEFLKSGT
jgi:hypothetical protein